MVNNLHSSCIQSVNIYILFMMYVVIPQVQRCSYSELNVSNDRDVGALIIMNSGSTVSLSVDVLADPCPSVVWGLNSIVLEPNNYDYNTITYNDPCIEENNILNLIWTYTLNVVLTSETSGHYLANFTNIAGTTSLHKVYITIPGMLLKH